MVLRRTYNATSLWVDIPRIYIAQELDTMVSPILPYADLATRNLVLHFTLLRGESIGLALVTEAGLFSTIASFVILMLISVSLEWLVDHSLASKTVFSAEYTWTGSGKRWISLW